MKANSVHFGARVVLVALATGVVVQGCSSKEASDSGATITSSGGVPSADGAGGQAGQIISIGSGGEADLVGGFTPDASGGRRAFDAGPDADVVGREAPSNIDECPGALSTADVAALQAGGTPDGRMLYPYDATVFPRGLLAPSLQWEGSSPSAVYLRLESKNFTYQGCFGPQAQLRLPVPQGAWDAAGVWSDGAGDPLRVTLSMLANGVVTTLHQEWTFALATIKGAVYYNTYTSPLAGLNGAVLKVLPGQAQPTPVLTDALGLPGTGPCYSCHSLSANGAMMVASHHTYGLLPSYQNGAYDVSSGTAQQVANGIPEIGFAGVFPDGSRVMTNGLPSTSGDSLFFPLGVGNIPALVGPSAAMLLDTTTGQQIPAAGWDGEVVHAQMPMFSPDGRHIVYNDYDSGAGHSLWVADFDASTNTFANRREIFTSNERYAGWPFFTPDSKSVVFALGTRSDFVSQIPDRVNPAVLDATGYSRLQIVYLDNPGQAEDLAALNGYSSGQSYLPGGDNDREFFPTVSPVAAGGYFWVFFTSRRTYGNTWVKPVEQPDSKKIWVSAIDIGGSSSADPSHPAFLLPGQEIESGNIRAFAALEPCRENGADCTSGTDCCVGFCTNGKCNPPPPDRMCSQSDERCEKNEDCCNPRDLCIAGFCAQQIAH